MSETQAPTPPAPHLPYWFVHFVAPSLKPEVTSLTNELKDAEPTLVAEFNAMVAAGETTAGAFVTKTLSNVHPGGVAGIMWGAVEGSVAAALEGELQQLGGLAGANGQQIFDTLYAKLLAFEAAYDL